MMNKDPLLTTSGNPVAEILEALMSQHRLNQTELASRAGVSQPAINRILKERKRAMQPRPQTLERIAAVLGVTPEQLSGQEPIASRMLAKGVVPLLAWEDLCHAATAPVSRTASAWLACPVEHSNKTFALSVVGEAMIGDDGYWEGDLIFVDPDVPPAHGKDVVLLKGENALFRRLVVTPEGRFLKTLNPGWPMPIMSLADDDASTVCGTVIFSGRVR